MPYINPNGVSSTEEDLNKLDAKKNTTNKQ